ncbi:MAG: ribosome silencing factor [Syntrophales bacterium]|nr:ribosome silencing factor [Syntrophales bacterium]
MKNKPGEEGIGTTYSSEETKARAILCVNAALKRKPHKLSIIRVAELSSFTDYFIVCSGGSDRQVQAIADAIREGLKRENILPLGIEGERAGQWILMDYGDVVVHIFYEPLREFYDIEGLWSDAPAMELEETTVELASPNDLP